MMLRSGKQGGEVRPQLQIPAYTSLDVPQFAHALEIVSNMIFQKGTNAYRMLSKSSCYFEIRVHQPLLQCGLPECLHPQVDVVGMYLPYNGQMHSILSARQPATSQSR